MTAESRDRTQNDSWVERRAKEKSQEGEPARGTKEKEPKRGTNKEEPKKENHPPVSRGN